MHHTGHCRLRSFSRALGVLPWVASGLLILVGGLVLAGWAFGIEPLKSIRPTWVSMKANTAIGFILLGAGLALTAAARPRLILPGAACALAAALLGMVTVSQYVVGRDFGIDEALFRDAPNAVGTSHPGRMAPVTGVAFGALGIALALQGLRRGRGPVGLLVGAAALLAWLSLVGYFYSSMPVFQLPGGTHVPAHTAIALLIAAAGVAALRPDDGLCLLLVAGGPGGNAARRLLPSVVVLPVAIGWLRLAGQRAGLYETEFAVSMVAAVTSLILALIVWASAASLHRQGLDLERVKDEFVATFEQAAVGIAHVAPDGRILRVNQRLCDLVKYSREELLARTFQDITYPADLDADQARLRQVLDGTIATYSMEKRYVPKGGGTVWVNLTVSLVRFPDGCPNYVIAVIEDIDARKRLEEQFRHAQKMEVVGHLAGGVAHDFNNLLTPIMGYTELVLARASLEPGARAMLEQVVGAARRGAGLTRQLLAFSRKQILQPVVVDLNALVSESSKLLQRLIGEDVTLKLVLAPGVGTVRVDPGQIDQVLMNLAVNARDAMPNGGTLTIETADVELDEAYARDHVDVAPGAYTMLAVSDTGVGMDRQTMSRIFEPFFTTKGRGKGTGLGLSTVHGIVKQSQGHIWAYSEPGRGTTFKVYLPRCGEKPTPIAPAKSPAPPAGGKETILVAEDDASLRAFVSEALSSLGYSVLCAVSGEHALDLSRSHPEAVHLLLFDVVMPGMNGRESAARIRASRPESRVLYMSGYTDNAIVHQGVLNEGARLLNKPFTREALARAVREALDA